MSINPKDFCNALQDNEIDFFAGVPDSLLKEFCIYLDKSIKKDQHIITANEGNAIALAAGYHLGTGKIPLVYMQNSGLGNAINPLLSLCDKEVYSIPMILLIGWRGEPGLKDEPQHKKQGKVQLALLDSMEIDYFIVDKEASNINEIVSKAATTSKKENKPFVLLIKKNTFSKNQEAGINVNKLELMNREDVLEILINSLPENIIIVSTTGKTSRELFEIREKLDSNHSRDFLTVGSMGHCSSIALGIALSNSDKKIICIDGDGALLMHLGSLSSIAAQKPKNFYHILINNEVHESVGGQETAIKHIDILSIINANHYNIVNTVSSRSELLKSIGNFIDKSGPNFLEIKVKPGSRKDLGRPNISPINNKLDFMKYIKDN
ncbi:phosphonopyruvate decarboxylase [Candidatus Marinimicrobia bacterium]|nr:phosphonopyruvate decarboxylase [Candidatus Neomarinimicrobiota bacterium]